MDYWERWRITKKKKRKEITIVVAFTFFKSVGNRKSRNRKSVPYERIKRKENI